MAVMGFTHDPGPLPFITVRDAEKWGTRLTNAMIEIVGERGCTMPLHMVRVRGITPIEHWQAKAAGLYVPAVYTGRRLIAVHLEALDG